MEIERLVMSSDHTQVVVPSIPSCDLCKQPSYADGRTIYGGWAYMCRPHFQALGIGLGLGRGQELILGGSDELGREDRSS